MMPVENLCLRIGKMITASVGTTNTNVAHGQGQIPPLVIPIVQGSTTAYVTIVSIDKTNVVLKASAACSIWLVVFR